MLKAKIECEYSELHPESWQPLPEVFGARGANWKLLHVSPESGSWTAAFFYPKGSSVPSHIHVGPGEYFMLRGKLEVRGGDMTGGVTATAPCYGYEATGARHDVTLFLEDTEVYMRFQGPLQMIDNLGNAIGVFGWEEVQNLWNTQLKPSRKKSRRKAA